MSPTELVHESYLRLLGQDATFENRAHFLALAATLMRRILVDRARKRHALRRGGGECRVTLDGLEAATEPVAIDIIALDHALTALASFDELQSRIVELHFFCGLSFDEVASTLGVSPSTVFREWRVARLWLLKQLTGDVGGRRSLETD